LSIPPKKIDYKFVNNETVAISRAYAITTSIAKIPPHKSILLTTSLGIL